MSKFEPMTLSAFEEIVEEDGQRCLVLFSRKSCPVCKSVSGKLKGLEDDYPDLPFYKVDVEEQPRLMSRFHLKGVPQTLLFSDGEMRSRLTGDASEDAFVDCIEAL